MGTRSRHAVMLFIEFHLVEQIQKKIIILLIVKLGCFFFFFKSINESTFGEKLLIMVDIRIF